MWEAVVVDNGSTDDTPAVVEQWACATTGRVRRVYEGRRGAAIARNTGVQCARADLIVFVDDDCYVAPDCLSRYAAAFEQESTLVFAGGRVLLFDPTDAPITIRTETTHEIIVPGSVVVPGVLNGASWAFRRAAFNQLSGFDPLFGPGQRFYGEELELAGRASAAGFKGMYLPGPLVYHHHGRKPGSAGLRRLGYLYAVGRGAYYAKGCLTPGMAMKFVKWWYWSSRRFVRERQTRILMWEALGALAYLRCRALRLGPL